jgi:hypothetical protein
MGAVAERQLDDATSGEISDQTLDLPGSVQSRGMGSWRIQVKIGESTCVGPYRTDRKQAETDLQEAQAAARDAMKTCIQAIKLKAAAEGAAALAETKKEMATEET